MVECCRTQHRALLMLVHKTIAYRRVNACAWTLIKPSYIKLFERKLLDRQQNKNAVRLLLQRFYRCNNLF